MRLSRQKFHSLFSAIHLSFPNRVFHDSIARVFFHNPIFKSVYPHNYCLYQAIFFIFTKQSIIRDTCCKFTKWHRISCHGTGFCVDSIYNIPNWNANTKKKIVSLFYLNEILSQSCNVLVTCSIAHSGHVFSAHFYHSILIDDLMIIFQSNLVIYGNKLIMESFTEQTSPVNSMCQTQMEKLKQKTLSVLIIKLYADSPNINWTISTIYCRTNFIFVWIIGSVHMNKSSL